MKPIIYWICLAAMVALILFGCTTTKEVVKTVNLRQPEIFRPPISAAE